MPPVILEFQTIGNEQARQATQAVEEAVHRLGATTSQTSGQTTTATSATEQYSGALGKGAQAAGGAGASGASIIEQAVRQSARSSAHRHACEAYKRVIRGLFHMCFIASPITATPQPAESLHVAGGGCGRETCRGHPPHRALVQNHVLYVHPTQSPPYHAART